MIAYSDATIWCIYGLSNKATFTRGTRRTARHCIPC